MNKKVIIIGIIIIIILICYVGLAILNDYIDGYYTNTNTDISLCPVEIASPCNPLIEDEVKLWNNEKCCLIKDLEQDVDMSGNELGSKKIIINYQQGPNLGFFDKLPKWQKILLKIALFLMTMRLMQLLFDPLTKKLDKYFEERTKIKQTIKAKANNTPIIKRYPDNTQRIIHPDGRIVDRYPDGKEVIEYPDKRKTTKYVDGREVTTYPDGREATKYLDNTVVTSHPDGRVVTEHPDGRKVTTLNDGSKITNYPDGREVTSYPDGKEKIKYTDGKEVMKYPDGREVYDVNGKETIKYMDGREVTIMDDGKKLTKYPDGRIETRYPDGKVNTKYVDGRNVTTFTDGREMTVLKDGTEIVRYPEPDSRVITKYPDGKIKVESPSIFDTKKGVVIDQVKSNNLINNTNIVSNIENRMYDTKIKSFQSAMNTLDSYVKFGSIDAINANLNDTLPNMFADNVKAKYTAQKVDTSMKNLIIKQTNNVVLSSSKVLEDMNKLVVVKNLDEKTKAKVISMQENLKKIAYNNLMRSSDILLDNSIENMRQTMVDTYAEKIQDDIRKTYQMSDMMEREKMIELSVKSQVEADTLKYKNELNELLAVRDTSIKSMVSSTLSDIKLEYISKSIDNVMAINKLKIENELTKLMEDVDPKYRQTMIKSLNDYKIKLLNDSRLYVEQIERTKFNDDLQKRIDTDIAAEKAKVERLRANWDYKSKLTVDMIKKQIAMTDDINKKMQLAEDLKMTYNDDVMVRTKKADLAHAKNKFDNLIKTKSFTNTLTAYEKLLLTTSGDIVLAKKVKLYDDVVNGKFKEKIMKTDFPLADFEKELVWTLDQDLGKIVDTSEKIRLYGIDSLAEDEMRLALNFDRIKLQYFDDLTKYIGDIKKLPAEQRLKLSASLGLDVDTVTMSHLLKNPNILQKMGTDLVTTAGKVLRAVGKFMTSVNFRIFLAEIVLDQIFDATGVYDFFKDMTKSDDIGKKIGGTIAYCILSLFGCLFDIGFWMDLFDPPPKPIKCNRYKINDYCIYNQESLYYTCDLSDPNFKGCFDLMIQYGASFDDLVYQPPR